MPMPLPDTPLLTPAGATIPPQYQLHTLARAEAAPAATLSITPERGLELRFPAGSRLIPIPRQGPVCESRGPAKAELEHDRVSVRNLNSTEFVARYDKPPANYYCWVCTSVTFAIRIQTFRTDGPLCRARIGRTLVDSTIWLYFRSRRKPCLSL